MTPLMRFFFPIVQVGKFSFFHKHSEEQQEELVKVAKYRHGNAEDILFRQEDQPDGLYIILVGRCGIFKTQGDMRKLVAVAGVGETVGDIHHLDEKCRRSISVQISSQNADLIEFSKEDLDWLAMKWRMQEEEEKTRFILTSIPVLNNVPYNVLQNLSPYFEKRRISKGMVVYRQQDESNAIFFVWTGRLQIVKRLDLIKQRNVHHLAPLDRGDSPSIGAGARALSEGEKDWHLAPKKQSRSVQIAMVGPGEYFGEVEVFNDLPRASAIIAMTDCMLLSLSRQYLTDVMPQSFLNALFRYSSMRVQWRNVRLALILDNLVRINWVPARDPKGTLEPELRPLAKMRSVLLPILSHPSSEERTWLGAHTVYGEEDAREWGLYYTGGWARAGDRADRAREDARAGGGSSSARRRGSTAGGSDERTQRGAGGGAAGSTELAPGCTPRGRDAGSAGGAARRTSAVVSGLVAQLQQRKAELLGASYFSGSEIKLASGPLSETGS